MGVALHALHHFQQPPGAVPAQRAHLRSSARDMGAQQRKAATAHGTHTCKHCRTTTTHRVQAAGVPQSSPERRHANGFHMLPHVCCQLGFEFFGAPPLLVVV